MDTSTETPDRVTGRQPTAKIGQVVAGYAGFSWLCLGLFAVLWLGELFLVQQLTLIRAQSGGARFDFWAPIIRFMLDALFVGTLCILLRARFLAVLTVLAFALHLTLVTYTGIRQCTLSMLTALTTFREGLSLKEFVLEWISGRSALLLLAMLAVKLGLLYGARGLRPGRMLRLRVGGALVSCFVLLYTVTLYLDPLSAILETRGTARLGIIRGYAGPWFAEFYYWRNPKILKHAIDRVRLRSDKLTPEEVAVPIHDKLVVIQVESLDFNVLNYEVDGRPVTPFLNQLAKKSLFYRARAYHVIGSADADFTMLSGGAPAMNVLNYSLPGFPYDDTLPQFLTQHGYSTSSFHGNYGNFYNRVDAYRQMGFDEILFREDLEKQGAFQADRIGLRDKDVLAFSSLKLRSATKPTCHFIITLTSHTPYVFLNPGENELISKPRDVVDRYFNHIHYTDACLRDYINSLGKGVTVILYADHATESGKGDFHNSREDKVEYVPVFIYDTSTDLASLQKTKESGLATDGELRMLDISAFLRNRVADSFNAKQSRDQSSSK